MKTRAFGQLLLLLLLVVGLMTACGGDWEALPEDCFPDEVYDEEDRLCYSAVDCEGEDCDFYGEDADDCFPDEVYDEEDGFCYPAVDCAGEDCEFYEEGVLDLFFGLVDEFFGGQDWETEDFTYSDDEEEILVTYQIDGNQIVEPEYASVASADLEVHQDNEEAHLKIWDYFADMIPQDQRSYLTEFIIFTDGLDETMASVEQDKDNPETWVLAIDIVDATNPEELTYTLIHEYGHLLTLNPSQVDPDEEIFYNPDDETLLDPAADACPRYFPGEGCSEPNAYIDVFFDRFWTDIYAEWLEISYLENDNAYYAALDNFYYDNENLFVTDYAATSPEEDIAESWAYFILKPKPDGDTVAEQKVLFSKRQV